MNNVANMFPETKPDLVTLLLQQVIAMAPDFSEALARQIEADFRAEHAGKTMQVLKRGPRLTPEQREAVFKDALTPMSTEEIIEKHKIHRATFFRLMKQGGRFGN